MGYYIRILGTQDPDIHLDELLESLKADGLSAKLAFAEGDTPDKWTLLEVANQNGDALTQIERNPVVDGELGQDELDEYKEELEDCKPTSAAKWLTSYFDRVKVIYAFQMLNAAFEDNNYDIVNSIRTKIWNRTGGIFQADGEGFSNEEGYHILWQFSDNVSGDWSCAVLNGSGDWETFVMDLGDKTQRKEFQDGKVPKSAKRL
jgi:hypothetical protein